MFDKPIVVRKWLTRWDFGFLLHLIKDDCFQAKTGDLTAKLSWILNLSLLLHDGSWRAPKNVQDF